MWYQNIIVKNRLINKVLRDTARAPQPPTKQPAGHLISQQGLYVPNKAYFGQKMADFGPNILIQPALGLLLTDSGVWGKTFWRVGWFFFYKSLTQKRKVEKLIARLEMNRLSEGYKQAVDKIWDHMAKNRFSGQKESFQAPKKTFTFWLKPPATTGRSCANK